MGADRIKTESGPFLLLPAGKDYLWGGTRLHDDFGKDLPISPLAETWECSTHPDGQSVAACGPFKGKMLGEILKEHPEYLGSHSLQLTGGKPELPILVKLIDAERDLSVQVHPDDEYALKNEGQPGKTEMWYVLAARKGAELIYGFNQDVDALRVRKALENDTIGNYLNHVPARKDDVFFIPSGTVHAIGSGILLAEVQQNSNLTYRLYDYHRLDKNGKPRTLSVDKALAVADLHSSALPRQPMRLLHYRNGSASEMLSRCRYFRVDRFLLNTEMNRELALFQTGSNSFHVLLCTDGCGVIFGEDSMMNFFRGDCIFIPASSGKLRLHGRACLLDISC